MKRIQVLSTRPYGHWFPIVSWLIRLIQWSAHSHVVYYDPQDKIIRHAHFNDIKEQTPDEFFEKNRLVDMKTVHLTDEQYIKINEYTASKIGKQSGYWSTLLGSLFPVTLRSIFGLKLKNPFYKGITCSEYIRAALRKVDEVKVFILTNEIPQGTFTTEDALELASNI